jgi:hypothetical protein
VGQTCVTLGAFTYLELEAEVAQVVALVEKVEVLVA